MNRFPFVGRIFWKVLVAVTVAIVLAFVLFERFSDYERTTTDIVGSTISGVLFSYLVHLWLLPGEEPPDEESQDTPS
jgi:hypothetical protein